MDYSAHLNINTEKKIIVDSATLYNTLQNTTADQNQLLATVTDGLHIGEQMLILDEEIHLHTASDHFLLRALPQIQTFSNGSTLVFEGENILIERIGKKPTLVICGGGHVAIEVLVAAKRLNFSVTVIEDRVLFANHARQANADMVICDNFEDGLKQIPGGKDTYFVVATRGHRYDKECLRTIFQKQYAYVGMMGSRGRVALLKQQFLDEGYASELLDTLHAPIGLNIGAETPAEIAISIVAELIQTKKKGRKATAFAPEVMRALTNKESSAVLCTIVKKRGSAPRSVGTRMVVFADHTVAGTIGGGCVEADVVNQAVNLLHSGETVKRITVSMSIADAEDQGLVCGGTVDILMQFIP